MIDNRYSTYMKLELESPGFAIIYKDKDRINQDWQKYKYKDKINGG